MSRARTPPTSAAPSRSRRRARTSRSSRRSASSRPRSPRATTRRAHFDFTRAQLVGGVGNRLDEVRAAQELTTDEVTLQNQEVALFRAREALGVLVAGDGAVDCRRRDLRDADAERSTMR